MRSALCVCVCVWCVCVCVFLFLETGHRFVVGHSPRLFLFNGAVGARHGRPKTVAAVATAARHRFRLIERLSLSIDTISLSLSLSGFRSANAPAALEATDDTFTGDRRHGNGSDRSSMICQRKNHEIVRSA